ncbi:hypothetical protein D6869_11400 [Lactococcus cremoris]|nr:hypothetical protein LLNZ_11700 [Lactococcus cremoris subsp. cremoris NZ9000]MCT4436357.1 hypothetical protein [Lactococcus cremoris]MCT4446442.1 hypothetical protein [Lactococcus cremoris]QTA77432.1 hypothetical protein D6869_11400 [Lactococcus cremoris]
MFEGLKNCKQSIHTLLTWENRQKVLNYEKNCWQLNSENQVAHLQKGNFKSMCFQSLKTGRR